MAQNFSLALDDLFGLGSTAELEQGLDKKYVARQLFQRRILTVINRERNVSEQQAELEALEARLKATEERLKASKLGKATAEQEVDEKEWTYIPSKAPVLPGVGLRTVSGQAQPQSAKKPAAASNKAAPADDSDESSGSEEEDEDSTEETSEDDDDEDEAPRKK